MSGDARFVGAWRLVSFAIRRPDGEVVQSMGEYPRGMIIYTAGGHMSVQIMDSNRPQFTSDARGGTDAEAAAAFRGYIAYCGTYRVEDAEGAVIHEPDVNVYPNWVGQPLKRYFTFDGDRLLLSGDRTPIPGSRGQPALVWQRVE